MRVDEQALSALIAGWGQTWNRYNVPYQFKSYKKGPISIDFLRCDYRVDEQATAKALRQQLYGLESGTVSACLACYDKQGKPFSIEASHDAHLDPAVRALQRLRQLAVVAVEPVGGDEIADVVRQLQLARGADARLERREIGDRGERARQVVLLGPARIGAGALPDHDVADMQRLWESDSFIDENTLTVNIARLRKKLEGAGLRDFIVTKKGAGYIVR